MTTQNQNLQLYRGDSAVVHVAMTNADSSPFDPTVAGLTISYRITRYPEDESKAAVRKELGNGITGTVGVGVDIVLQPEDTDLPLGLYAHELKVIDGSDVAATMTGFVVIKRAVRMGKQLKPVSRNLQLTTVSPLRVP